MSTKATIAPGYRLRLLLMTFLLGGFGVYSVYDGKIAYPKKKEIGLAYQAYKSDPAHEHDFNETWRAYAKSKGWPEKIPTKVKSEAEYNSDIMTQWIMAGITLPIGLFFGYKLLQESRRWVAMDDAGLTASGGRVAPWDTLKGLERSRWKTKGIARVIYHDEAKGADRQILLDDFKANRAAVGEIYNAVVARVYPEEVAAQAKEQEIKAQEEGV
ncbi:MAG: hypothetical protein V3V20_06100 [Algisphaera sp.]